MGSCWPTSGQLLANCWVTVGQPFPSLTLLATLWAMHPRSHRPSWPPGHSDGSWSAMDQLLVSCGQLLVNCWPTRPLPHSAGHALGNASQVPPAFLATRAQCWLVGSCWSISGQPLVNCWPTTGELLVNHWATIDQVLANCWVTNGQPFPSLTSPCWPHSGSAPHSPVGLLGHQGTVMVRGHPWINYWSTVVNH